MAEHEMSGDDVLVIRDIIRDYKLNPNTVRSWKRRGKLGEMDGTAVVGKEVMAIGWRRETVEKVVEKMVRIRKGEGE